MDEEHAQGSLADYELPYGERIPSSYDAAACAQLIEAEAAFREASGGSSLFEAGELWMLRRTIRAYARQFRGGDGDV